MFAKKREQHSFVVHELRVFECGNRGCKEEIFAGVLHEGENMRAEFLLTSNVIRDDFWGAVRKFA